MRVLHFYKTYYPDTVGGVEQVIYQICRGAAPQGVESTVLSLTRDRNAAGEMELDGHKVYRAHMNFEIASNAFSLESFSLFKKLARQADIIHYHYPWPFGDVVHFAARHGKKSVVTYHSDIVRQQTLLKLYRPLQRRFLNDVNRIVATSPNYFDSSATLQLYRHKVEVIPIGIEPASYPSPNVETVAKWRRRFGERFFLFIGMLRYYKGLDVLIKAAAGVDVPIIIAGAGPMELELKNQVERLGLRNVYFLGTVSEEDKVALLQLCYAVILPSHLRSEAFGVSLLEGAMLGKPLISCKVGTGTSFINKDGETGFVTEPLDAKALSNAMRALLGNATRTRNMGRAANRRFSELFTAQRMARAYANLYRTLLY